MHIEPRTIAIDGGSVSAVLAHPDGGAAGEAPAVILGHGAGNDMRNAFLSTVHERLAECGYLTVKFNFPYTEQRRRAPDPASVLESCFRRVVAAIRDELHPRGIVLGGKSMGGRMASHLAAQGEACDGLLFLGYPLHPAGKPEKLRVAHLGRIAVPMLFFAGTRDALCRLDLLRPAIAGLRVPVTLHVVEGGDHSFKVPKSLRRSADDVLNEIVSTSAEWLARTIPAPRS